MVLPSSGSSISFDQIQTEFGGSNPISMNEYGDKIGLTVGTTSTHSINSFFGLSASIHDTTFKPQYFALTLFPGVNAYFSGVNPDDGGSGSFTDNAFPNSGTFSDGTTTHSANAVILDMMAAYSVGNSATGSNIFLKMRTSSGPIANGVWTTMEIYANTTGSGTPLLSLNRTDASFTSNDGGSPASALWSWSGTYAFSTFFGTNPSPPGSATHLFRLV